MAAASDGRTQLGQQVGRYAEPGSSNTRATTRSRRARSSSPTAPTSAPRPRSQLVCTTRPAPPTTSARLRTTSPAPSTPVGAPTSPLRARATANSLRGPSPRKTQRSGPNWYVPLIRSAARSQARQLCGGIQEHQAERRPPLIRPHPAQDPPVRQLRAVAALNEARPFQRRLLSASSGASASCGLQQRAEPPQAGR